MASASAEGPLPPAVAPLHGAIHGGDVVGDLRDHRSRVEGGPGEHPPQELRGLVVACQDRARRAAGIGLVGGRLQRGQLRLLPRPVLEGLPVEGEDVVAHLLVEARARLLAQQAPLHHLVHEGGDLEDLSLGVARHRRVEVLRHLRGHVHPRNVGGAEGRALRPAEGGAGEGVHLLDREIEVHHRPKGRAEAEGPDAVGDEVGRVLAAHDPLAEDAVGEGLEGREHLLVGFRPRDRLEELQVARRVEEVRAEEAPADLDREVRRHLRDAEARGVARHEGGLPDERGHPREELLLDRQVLDHRLEHPVGVLELAGEVVLEVPRPQERRVLRQMERAGLELAQGREALLGGRARDRRPRPGTSSRATSSPCATTWAATWAPMVPAPSTTTFLMRRLRRACR